MRTTEPARMWAFHNAPEEYKRESRHGGDEDILIFFPTGFFDSENFPTSHGAEQQYITRIREAIGICGTDLVPVEGGFLWIGAHS